MPTHTATPVSLSDRSDILDILRGVAVLGICLANYRVFSLYIFQKPETLQPCLLPLLINGWPIFILLLLMVNFIRYSRCCLELAFPLSWFETSRREETHYPYFIAGCSF